MRILFIHCQYRIKGGEDNVVNQEIALLEKSYEICLLRFYNASGIRGLIQFLCSPWNYSAVKQIRKVIIQFQPDIVHFHNTHFGVGPLGIREVYKLGLPIVKTLHNYRLICPSGTMLYNENLFLESLKEYFPLSAIRRKVYRNSFFLTFWLASVYWFHNKIGTWKMVDRYIILTPFVKELFLKSNLYIKPEQFVVKPNFVEDKFFKLQNRGSHFLYVGRLSEEKGINFLLNLFSNLEYELYIAGDGPMKERVVNFSDNYNNIKYLGVLNSNEIRNEMSKCSALLFPSIWYETFGLTIIEAFSMGTPVIASNLGSPQVLIVQGSNGELVTAGNIDDWKNKLFYWQNLDSIQYAQYCNNARLTYLKHYTPELNREQLIAIYQIIINGHKKKGS